MKLPWRRRPKLRYTLDEYAQMVGQFAFNGISYQTGLSQTLQGTHESIENDFVSYVNAAYKANGIVFACMLVRRSIFTEARFRFRDVRRAGGRPGPLFGTEALRVLERPFPGGVTGDLLARMIDDADLAGNWYGYRDLNETVRLRPDWVDIALTPRIIRGGQVGFKKAGYVYYEGGGRGHEGVPFSVDEISHFAPNPDPISPWRGMSWLTPVIREIAADKQATTHKQRFYENGATPNMVIKLPEMTKTQFEKFKAQTDGLHKGAENAYKCLHPDTDVAMWDGRRVPARSVAPGDVVVAWNDGRAVPGVVSAAEWQPDSPIVTVTTQRGRTIRTNDRHPFLVGERWVDAADLRPGDMLTTGLGWGDGGGVSDLTNHEAWLLGALVGDGSLVSSTPVVSAWDPGVRGRFARDHQLNHTGKGHDYRMLGVTKLARQYGLMGARSWQKRIPESVMTAPASVRAAFLSGLIDTDGHVSSPALRRTMELGIASVSRDLLLDAQHLLASLGINSTVSCIAEAGRYSGRAAYRLCAFGNGQARRLADLLDLACAAKRERLDRYASTSALNARDSSRFDRVVSVEVGQPEPTIGIEVADRHTHVTGGVVTHNTMYLGGGADVEVVGKDFQQIDFKQTQGAGETRIAAAAGVHPVIIGLSEGLAGSSLNQGNFNAARRLTADKMLRPLWRNAAASLEQIVTPPAGAELWYDERDVAFLREDQKDIAEIQAKQAVALRQLTDAGFEPDAAVQFLLTDDLASLAGQHSGLFSVQLQPPGASGGGSAQVQVRNAAELVELVSKGWTPARHQPLALEAA